MRSSELEKSASKGGKYTIILQSQGLAIHNAPKSSILSGSGPMPKSDQNQGICKIKCKTLSVFNMDKKRASLQTVAGCYDFSFLLSHRSSNASPLLWTNFFPSFADALRLNPASITSRRAWLTSPFITDVFYFMCNVLYSLHPSIARTTYSLYPPQLFCFGHRLVRAPGPHLYKTTSPVLISLT